MATLKPYPHYEIQVKDNSVRDVTFEEVLPVHRALYVIRAQEGPVGDPVWCRDYTQAAKIFGEQTFKETSKYFSPQAFFLKNTFTYNGAFIVRALDSNAQNATLILEAVVEAADIPQYEVDSNPNSDTYGQRIVDLDPESATYGEYIPLTETETATTTDMEPYLIGGAYVKLFNDGTADPGTAGYIPTFKVLGTDSNLVEPGGAGYITTWEDSTILPNSVTGATLTYQTSTTLPGLEDDWAVYEIEVSNTTSEEVAVTEPGLKITWKVRNATTEEIEEGLDSLETITNGTVTVYPILAIESLYPGEYGNDLAFRFFYDKRNNEPSTIKYFGSVFGSFGVYRRDYNSSTTNAIYDRYGKVINVFSINPASIDKESGIKQDMAAVLGRVFDDDTHLLPYTIYTFEDNYKTIGERIIGVETPESLCTAEIAEDGTTASGFQVNILSGVNCHNVPYDHVHVVGRISSDSLDTGEIILDSNIDQYLNGGTDGNSIDDAFVDHSMYRFCKLYMNRKIVDKFRYPFTHIYDVGYSITTKYALLDFINTRDDVMVELATQVLFPSTWIEGITPTTLVLNDMDDDISIGQALRERALLMRESIKHNTDTCRVAIYTQSGYPISATYDKPVPFTFWSAMQNAKYGNKTQMSQTEPRGWPYSYNTLFKNKSWIWMNYEESGKENTWNSGLNYCQFADMARIFYPALRTVYRNETSVLVDQWVVNAVVYTKHVCRKAWGKYTGRNDPIAVLQSSIKNYLEAELSSLYNGKYSFSVTVYQTEEEQAVGYVQHVKVSITFPATMRVLDIDIEVNRENLTQDEEA